MRWWTVFLLVASGCGAAFVEFPANDLSFDVPAVATTTVQTTCSGDPAVFVAQFNATGRAPENLGTIVTSDAVEWHPVTLRSTQNTDFPVEYRLGPLLTGVSPEQAVSGESTALDCDDLEQTSVAIGILDGFGSAVECVQWVGAETAAPDEWQSELMDIGCISFDL